MQTLRPPSSLCWHAQSKEEVMRELRTTLTGLSQTEAETRLKLYGFNELPEISKRNIVLRFFLQFHNILIYVLLGSATITAFLAHWLDTGVILAVIIANAIIGFLQEGKAEKAINAIHHLLSPHAAILRHGERQSIEGKFLVPGDIVLLEAGDKVPADMRLLQAHNLTIQESLLTGESVPVEKHTAPADIHTVLGDRSCMAFSGTLVTTGQGKGVVVATGAATEMGHINSLVSEVEVLTTPLIKQMDVFAKGLTFFILVIAALLLGFGYFVKHYSFTEIFMAVVGLSVAAIPEGLPAVLTITLALGVQAMAKRHVIIRRLPSIETLGSVSVVCTDKTGTLTRNEMMVTSVVTSQHFFTVEGTGYQPQGSVLLEKKEVKPEEYKLLQEIGRTALLCNNASLRNQEGIWVVEGDPMEGALLAFSSKMGQNICSTSTAWPRKDAIAFDAKHRFMATLNQNPEQQALIFVKGAPEQILSMCNSQHSTSHLTEPLNISYWHQQAETIAALGQRVLALASRSVSCEHTVLKISDIEGTLTLLGMVGMIDPPREEAITAIAECHAAGIHVKMITGDHAKTASAIGKHIGLKNPDTVFTGTELDAMDDLSLQKTVCNCDIFARTTPEHKLRLVMALQSQGMIVAMTGDGVNDAPALKRADAGVAMGKKGSEAAKEVAELILTDDNFVSIVAAIREGRTVYDNIKKVIGWTLPTNAGEAMILIIALLLGITLPVTPIQILWVNLITCITLGLALAFEPTEENTMRRPPRSRHQPLLTGLLVWHIVMISILFIGGVFSIHAYAIAQNYPLELARTMSLNTLVVMEIFHLFFIRNIYGTSLTWKAIRGTKVIWATIIIVTLAQGAITYLPPLQAIFATHAVSFFDSILILGVGGALFGIGEIEKQIRLRFFSLL